MEHRKNWAGRAVDMASQVAAEPVLEITGEKRVLIEHHQGITQYGREQICVRVRFGQLRISGQAMVIARMTREQLVICGRIDGVQLLRRGACE